MFSCLVKLFCAGGTFVCIIQFLPLNDILLIVFSDPVIWLQIAHEVVSYFTTFSDCIDLQDPSKLLKITRQLYYYSTIFNCMGALLIFSTSSSAFYEAMARLPNSLTAVRWMFTYLWLMVLFLTVGIMPFESHGFVKLCVRVSDVLLLSLLRSDKI